MKKNDFLIQYFEKRQSKIFKFFTIFLSVLAVFWLLDKKMSSANFIAKINLEGIISDRRDLVDKINEIKENPNFKGLIIVINSPGGTFVSSKEIFDALEKVSNDVPTSAYIRELGTSGAYLASLGVDKIFVNHGSITGSVGVILQTAELTSLLQKIGIEPIVIKSGSLKAVPNLVEKLDTKKIDYMKEIIKKLQDEFVGIVKQKRNLNNYSIEKISDGRIFTSSEALELNLIDFIGNEEDAINWIRKQANLDKDIKILELDKKKKFLDFLNVNFLKNSLNSFNLNLNNGILAIWMPGL